MSAKRNFKPRSSSRNNADTQVIRDTAVFKDTVEQVKERLQVAKEDPETPVVDLDETDNNPNETADIEKALLQITGIPGVYGKIDRSSLIAAPEDWNYFDQLPSDKKALMVESIYNNGLLQPIIVRAIDPDNKTFQILAGHNRNFSYEVLREITGDTMYESIDAKIYWYGQIDDEQAKAIIEDTNYIQRGSLSAKDRTKYICNKVLSLKRDSIKTGNNGDIMSLIADQLNVNRTTVYHWKKIEKLIPEIMKMFEIKAISLVTAAKIASFSPLCQRNLYERWQLVTNESIRTLKPKMHLDEVIPALEKFFEKKSPEVRGKILSEIQDKTGNFIVTVDKVPKEDEVPIVLYLPKDRAKTLLTKLKEYIITTGN